MINKLRFQIRIWSNSFDPDERLRQRNQPSKRNPNPRNPMTQWPKWQTSPRWTSCTIRTTRIGPISISSSQPNCSGCEMWTRSCPPWNRAKHSRRVSTGKVSYFRMPLWMGGYPAATSASCICTVMMPSDRDIRCRSCSDWRGENAFEKIT